MAREIPLSAIVMRLSERPVASSVALATPASPISPPAALSSERGGAERWIFEVLGAENDGGGEGIGEMSSVPCWCVERGEGSCAA